MGVIHVVKIDSDGIVARYRFFMDGKIDFGILGLDIGSGVVSVLSAHPNDVGGFIASRASWALEKEAKNIAAPEGANWVS